MKPSVILLSLLIALASPEAEADEVVVCPDCPIHSLKDAIQAVQPGGTVRVQAGTYSESNLVIRKPIHLLGAGRPVVDAGGQGNVFLVNAPDVEISGFVVRNSGIDYVEDLAGIKVMESSGCRIVDNEVRDCYFGIYLGKSRNCLIERNKVSGANRGESSAGNGIHIWYGENMVLLDNEVVGNRDGIYFEFVKNSRILRNRSERSLRYGLHFMFSNDDEYQDNVFKENGSGVAVMYSRNIRMSGNHFETSLGGSSYGVLLKDISASEIRGNVFAGNTVGAYLEGTTRSNFRGNTFTRNGWALRVLGNTDSNVFEGNDFTLNTFDVATNASSNLNRFTGNYWDAYRGVDLDHDGFGDDPFRPVRLSSLLMEKYGVSVLLLKSYFFAILDEAERALPVLTPSSYQDERPRMRSGGVR